MRRGAYSTPYLSLFYLKGYILHNFRDGIERYMNVTKQNKKDTNETEYYATLLAEKLGDQKSLTYYKIACQRSNPHVLLQKAAEIIADGGARNPGAVFAEWVKTRNIQSSQTSHP